MWVKLGSDYVNLDHVYRVRLAKGFHKGEEEWTAEVESIDPRGQTTTVTRYRGADALLLQTVLAERCQAEPVQIAPELASTQAHVGTIADMKLP